MKNADYELFIIHIGEMLVDAQYKYIINSEQSKNGDFYNAIDDVVSEIIEFGRQNKED